MITLYQTTTKAAEYKQNYFIFQILVSAEKNVQKSLFVHLAFLLFVCLSRCKD